MLNVFDPYIPSIEVQGAQQICVFVQDQLYLSAETRWRFAITFCSYWERNLDTKLEQTTIFCDGQVSFFFLILCNKFSVCE